MNTSKVNLLIFSKRKIIVKTFLSIIKDKFVLKDYLIDRSIKKQIIICKFRLPMGNHNLPVVQGRFVNINREILYFQS